MLVFLRNIFAVIIGLVVGSFLNMTVINLGYEIFPLPHGLDVNTEEGFKNAITYFKFENYIFPFLAHALGTLIGSLICTLLSKNYKLTFSLIIGFIFLAGGIYMVSIVESPLAFTLIDLILSYIPMAFLGHYIGNIIIKKTRK